MLKINKIIFVFFVFIFVFIGCSNSDNNKKTNSNEIKNNIIKNNLNNYGKKNNTTKYYTNFKIIPNDFNKYKKYLEKLFAIENLSNIYFPKEYKDLSDINYFKYQFYYINKIINKGVELYGLFKKKNICSFYNMQDKLSSLFGMNVLLFQDLTGKEFYDNFRDFLGKKYKNNFYSGILVLDSSKENFSFITLKDSKPAGLSIFCDAYKILKIENWEFFKDLNKYLKITYIFDNQLEQLDKIILSLKDVDKEENTNINLEISFIVKSKFNGNDLYKSLSLMDSIKKIKFNYISNDIKVDYKLELFMKIPNNLYSETNVINGDKLQKINKLIHKYNLNNFKDYYFLFSLQPKTKTVEQGAVYIYENKNGKTWKLEKTKKFEKGSLLPF